MKRILPVTLGIFALILSACGTSAEATPVKLEPATKTFSPPVETSLPAPTDTPAPVATAVPSTTPAPAEVSFANDVQPILNAYCVKCHGVEYVKEGLNMTGYDNLMTGSFNGAVIVPGNAGASLLIDMVTKGKMPKRGEKPSAGEIQVIINWINAGALNN